VRPHGGRSRSNLDAAAAIQHLAFASVAGGAAAGECNESDIYSDT
jgi:hypothetical protein